MNEQLVVRLQDFKTVDSRHGVREQTRGRHAVH